MTSSPSQFSCSSQSSIYSDDDVTAMMASGMYFDDLYDMSVFLYKGHFGDTYRCVERETGTKYAVKVLPPVDVENSKNSSSGTANFSREGAIWRRLKHKNIAQLCRIFSTPKEQFLVTEYVKDGKLFDQLPQMYCQSYTEHDVCSIIKQLLEGLAFLRKRRVINRCLTTENILVKQLDNGENVLKISDFSFALRLERGQKYIKTESQGVPLFVSPEVLLENPINYGVDSWAAGVIFYILLTGQPPFWNEKLEVMYRDILTRPITTDVALSAVLRGVSPYAKDVLTGLLDKNMKSRLSPDSALNHSWFKGNSAVSSGSRLDGAFEKLSKNFNQIRNTQDRLFEVKNIFSEDAVEDIQNSNNNNNNNNDNNKNNRNNNSNNNNKTNNTNKLTNGNSSIIQSYGGMRRKKQFDAENKRNGLIIDGVISDERRCTKVISRTKASDLSNNTCTATVFLSFKPKKTYINLKMRGNGMWIRCLLVCSSGTKVYILPKCRWVER